MEDSYLVNLDGTGYFSSNKLYSPACLEKKSRSDKITYHLQAVGAALVCPGFKEVIPLCPEIIRKQDGITKNDCEHNATKRMLGKLREDHPHMNFIINEDGLASNAPHLSDIEKHGFHYISGVKEGDHKYLFAFVDQAVEDSESIELTIASCAVPVPVPDGKSRMRPLTP